MQCFCGISAVHQMGGHIIHIHLGAAKYQSVKGGLNVNDAAQGVELVPFGHFKIHLVGQVGSHLFRFHGNGLVPAHVAPGNGKNFPGHGGGEQQRGAFIRCIL